ncbi:hypothetical protein OS493_006927 [Desmophyllum pertusum]|uniref:Uncharacterized protein n=1 Tax=Desmophyllum pertusum TaxID=174260 RepID=A0A9X0D5Y1_9CNID|nr:hypothetical protein OS493_006927 [Desmophyllum pertusum]
MAGFQHGELPFILKQITIAPVKDGIPHTLTFNTKFLLSQPPRAMQTYNYQARAIHGISIDHPGIPYSLRQEAVSTAVKESMFGLLQYLPAAYQDNPRVLLLTKGSEKVLLFESLIPAQDILVNCIVRDLSDYGCPLAHRLLGLRCSTTIMAVKFCAWFKGCYGCVLGPNVCLDLPQVVFFERNRATCDNDRGTSTKGKNNIGKGF